MCFVRQAKSTLNFVLVSTGVKKNLKASDCPFFKMICSGKFISIVQDSKTFSEFNAFSFFSLQVARELLIIIFVVDLISKPMVRPTA